jgi:hypothetical protein
MSYLKGKMTLDGNMEQEDLINFTCIFRTKLDPFQCRQSSIQMETKVFSTYTFLLRTFLLTFSTICFADVHKLQSDLVKKLNTTREELAALFELPTTFHTNPNK